MPLSHVTGRYYQGDSQEFPSSLSWQQLFVLYVAANYMLYRSRMGWWADQLANGIIRIHSQATVKSLVKKGLLDGTPRGEAIALGGWDWKSTMEPAVPALWTSEKGRRLLDKIEKETGLFFDKESYELIVPDEEADEERDRMIAGHRQIALAYNRAVKLVNGQDAETNFPSEESPPEESELVVLFIEALRQINALKAGRGRLQ